MGTVVHFSPRSDTARAKSEAILSRLGEFYQQRLKAKDELPVVLAKLLAEGYVEIVHQAITVWGSGELEAYEVLRLVEEMAAVSGNQTIGKRSFNP